MSLTEEQIAGFTNQLKLMDKQFQIHKSLLDDAMRQNDLLRKANQFLAMKLEDEYQYNMELRKVSDAFYYSKTNHYAAR